MQQILLNDLLIDLFQVAVFDATNTTRKRRAKLYDAVVVDKGFRLFFVESVCDREDIIDSNIREVKVTSPDYAQCDEDKEEIKFPSSLIAFETDRWYSGQ